MNRPSLILDTATAGLAPLRVVQITDSHLFGEPERALLGVPTAASFAAVVEQVHAETDRPDQPASAARGHARLAAAGDAGTHVP